MMFRPDFLRVESNSEPAELKPLPVAGYANLDDVDALIFDIKSTTDTQTIIQNIGTGFNIWTARDLNNHWNVYRATNVPGVPFILRYNVNSQAELVMNADHGLAVNDLVVLKNFDNRYDGIYKVDHVIDSERFLITITSNLQELIDNEAVISNGGILYKLQSAVFEKPTVKGTVQPKPFTLKAAIGEGFTTM